jgi:thiol-disulfide isomerase/thioredoxin
MPAPTSQSPHRFWLALALAFFVFWIVYLRFFAPRPPSPLENSGMSTPAAYEWSLVDLNDQPVRFTRFKGKPIFLNIWATWCGPCVAEMPSIARLAQDPKLRGKGIEFVCVSVDRSTELVREFVKDKGWPMTILRAEQLPAVFRSEGFPTTFLIGPEGRIAGFLVGATKWDEAHAVDFLLKLADGTLPNRK